MSTYFYGCCHNCKVFIEASNVHLKYAGELTERWAARFGHADHNTEAHSEYANELFEGFYADRSPYTNVTHQVEQMFDGNEARTE